MTTITSFVFNPFYENTYIIADENNDCWVVDPGCYSEGEQMKLINYITEKQLRPVLLLNTHCHLDHIFGNSLIAKTYNLSPYWHENETQIAKNAKIGAMMFGVKAPEYVEPGGFLKEGEVLTIGSSTFKILFTPGHSPGSVSFYNEKEKYVIVGDVLFRESIGRTDLPGGNFDVLIKSIKKEILTLPEDTVVYNGHGEPTTIGHEKKYNPFLR
ncbi:MAG: MBL fold metallo-hydrolase [Chitinophagales bacterium]|nr:MBL fold metallo-hydrolase [Chitinophagales bacterium]MCZ2392998.1 MBL fold metallo-hydrolase [Chitinophagales bacterium]